MRANRRPAGMPHSEAVDSPEADATAPERRHYAVAAAHCAGAAHGAAASLLVPRAPRAIDAMAFAVVHSRALRGLDAPAVTVEVHLANGLPSFTLVGLADTEVKEARERVRAALQTSGLEFPHNKRITVNLAPADLPKESGRFDLPIALGILAAAGQIDAGAAGGASSSPASCRSPASCGRCAARWRWRLAMQRAPARASARARWCCRSPAPTRRRWSAACAVRGAAPPARRRARAAARRGRRRRRRCAMPCRCGAPPPRRCPTCATCKGQAGAKRALEIAAAGGAQPADGRPARHRQVDAGAAPRRPAAAAERTTRRSSRRRSLSVAGALRRPRAGASGVLRAPHHTASAAALVGGGSPPRPGEISLAHHGVLFLDELPEFPRAALEALREPLETGRIIDLARRAAGRVPGPLPARRGDEPLPLRPARQSGAGLPLHARRGAALPGRASAGRCSTASTCRSRCRRSPPSSSRPRPTASRARRSRERVAAARAIARRAPGRDATRGSPATRSTGTAASTPPRRASCRRRRRGSAGRRGAFTACCGSPARSPTSPPAPTITHRPPRRGDPVPARPADALTPSAARPPAPPAARKKNGQPAGCPSIAIRRSGISRPSGSRGRAGSCSGSGRSC